jgi:ABC-type methionine transport system ATPase subunit
VQGYDGHNEDHGERMFELPDMFSLEDKASQAFSRLSTGKEGTDMRRLLHKPKIVLLDCHRSKLIESGDYHG